MRVHWSRWQRSVQTLTAALRALVANKFPHLCPICTRSDKSTEYSTDSVALTIRPLLTRTVLSWTRPLAASETQFALFRGPTLNWLDAIYLQTPIFCQIDETSATISYQSLDLAPQDSGTYYYWLLAQSANSLQRQGPFLLQMHRIDDYALLSFE